ncbi:MAG TPA: SDR family oxidoreductase [Blastocatellia bacterium]|nr:SDR family oxidoreductase [Blastocatellia bacterium]
MADAKESTKRISGKSALVTGGTRGIGFAVARALLDRGARVLVCSRGGENVRRSAEVLAASYGERVLGRVCDVRDPNNVAEMFREAGRLFGGLDILINNAGIGSRSYIEQMGGEEWRSTIETNLSGVFYCCHEAIPLMKKSGGGDIINIGSLAGTSGFAGGGAYCASKYGLIGFSEALMQEVRYDHIRVSCVMPGSVNTGFARGGQQDPAATWKLAPEDVAAVVLGVLEMDSRALVSRVEVRPSEPRK